MQDQFLKNIHKIIEDNISDEHFSVEELARQAGISRSMLHRKLTKLTGKSAGDLITEKRLTRAREYLEKNSATVSEIAYRVGFNSPSYFNKVFKKHFKIAPGIIKKKATKAADQSVLKSQRAIRSPFPDYLLRNKVIVVVLILILAAAGVYFSVMNIGTGEKSLAILPLQNLTGQPSNDYFVEGMHDALIGELGKISSLRVISRTSTLRYRNTDMLLKDIASELGVNTIVEGSVIGAGDSVRVVIQLIDVFPEENHLLVKDYRDGMYQVRLVQSKAVQDIARQIEVELTNEEMSYLSSPEEVNPDAYKAYLKGRFYWDKLTENDLNTSLYYFELARDMDPNSALAYAGISLAWIGRQQQGLTPHSKGFDIMKTSASKALAMDSTLSDVHFVLGVLNCWGEWKYQEGIKAFRKAISINPNNSSARAYLSQALFIARQDREMAIGEIKRAIELDPFNPLYKALYGMDLLYDHRYEEALHVLQRNLEIAPNDALTLSTIRTAYHLQGMHEEALEMWKKSYETRGDQSAVAALKEGNKKNGYQGALENLAEMLIRRSDSTFVTPWQIATLYTRAGNTNEAMEWLEKAYLSHDQNMPHIGVDPIFESLKADDRFVALLQKMNLTE